MKYNFQKLYKEFEKVKTSKEYMEYCKNMSDNLKVINNTPFDGQKARKQIANMTREYGEDFNWLAEIYGNGMTVVPFAHEKSDDQLKDELIYINNQIPIIALKRELASYAFDKLLGIE